MVSTTMGVRLDDETRERIKAAAQKIDRTPHWLIRQAIFDYLAQLDSLPGQALRQHPPLWGGGRGSGEIREIGTAAGVQSGRDCRAVAARRWHPLRGGQQPGRTQAQGRAREDGRLGAHGNRAV